LGTVVVTRKLSAGGGVGIDVPFAWFQVEINSAMPSFRIIASVRT
jgi:hypothetical protein